MGGTQTTAEIALLGTFNSALGREQHLNGLVLRIAELKLYFLKNHSPTSILNYNSNDKSTEDAATKRIIIINIEFTF